MKFANCVVIALAACSSAGRSSVKDGAGSAAVDATLKTSKSPGHVLDEIRQVLDRQVADPLFGLLSSKADKKKAEGDTKADIGWITGLKLEKVNETEVLRQIEEWVWGDVSHHCDSHGWPEGVSRPKKEGKGNSYSMGKDVEGALDGLRKVIVGDVVDTVQARIAHKKVTPREVSAKDMLKAVSDTLLHRITAKRLDLTGSVAGATKAKKGSLASEAEGSGLLLRSEDTLFHRVVVAGIIDKMFSLAEIGNSMSLAETEKTTDSKGIDLTEIDEGPVVSSLIEWGVKDVSRYYESIGWPALPRKPGKK